MTGIPSARDDDQPREWNISNRTLIVSAGSQRVLAVLSGRDPLLLPPGSVLQFGDPLGELVVTRVRVIVGDGAGTVCAEAEPVPKPRHRTSATLGDRTERTGHLHPVRGQPPRWSRVRPGNG